MVNVELFLYLALAAMWIVARLAPGSTAQNLVRGVCAVLALACGLAALGFAALSAAVAWAISTGQDAGFGGLFVLVGPILAVTALGIGAVFGGIAINPNKRNRRWADTA